jgi:hypothetical protein
VPDGDPAVIVEQALALLVAQLERTKFAAKTPPPRHARLPARTHAPDVCAAETLGGAATAEASPGETSASADHRSTTPAGPRLVGRSSRFLPAAVRRAVWMRDEGRCAFRGAGGRCRETGRLEFHHRIPLADGGPTSVANLELRCTAHHAYESARWFGEEGIGRADAGRARPVASDA